MRILHVVPTYFPARRYGGPIVAVHGLCKALVARGHDVQVMTTNVDGPHRLDVSTDRAVNLDGVQVRYFPSAIPRLYWSSQMQRALRQEAGSFDLIHIHAVYLWPGVAAARAARRAKVPYVISPRGMLVPELIQRKSGVVKKLWLSVVERRGFKHASGIHFTSQPEWDDALRVGLPLPSPFVVSNGVDLPARPHVPRDDRTLVFVGRITWKKGLDRVIEALPRLPAVRLVIVGNDEEDLKSSLLALAERIGVADRVEFRGPLYGPAKDEALARAALFVLLSTNENFGNAVLEALAMETPAVLSEGVGLASAVVAAGAGVIGLDDVLALLEDEQRRTEMGRRGRALVESQFAWSAVAEQMEEAYCSIKSRR